MANSGFEENSVKISLPQDSESESDLEVVEEVIIHQLSEEELAQLLAESGLDDEIFSVPITSLQPLFASFLQRVVKILITLLSSTSDITSPSNASSMLPIGLEYALDTIEKLITQAGPNRLTELSGAVLLQHPEVISVLLDFVVKVWQGNYIYVYIWGFSCLMNHKRVSVQGEVLKVKLSCY